MAKLKAMPSIEIIDGFRGVIDFYLYHPTCDPENKGPGVPVARKWPRSPSLPRSLAVQATWPIFAAAVHAWPTLTEEIQDTYRTLAVGSGLSGRDMFIKGYIKGIYRYPKGEEMLPACWVYVASPFDNLMSGTWYTVPFDGEIYDKGGNFDPVTHQFTAPRAGRYLVVTNILFTTMVAAGQRWLRIEQNAGEKAATRKDNTGISWQTLSLSALLDCAQGDRITAGLMQSSGANTVDVGAYSNWSNMFISLLE